MSTNLSNQEPKGTRDWLPDEFLVRKYIFDTWRKICLSYGFEEYLTPLVESAEIYRVKSGEDVGGKELVTFTDLGGRELSIRPEMTPSVTRMVTKVYNKSPKPLKYFSIANFMRNEKPQRGRNREFWQLNVDTFGSDSLEADIEIMQLALDLMLEFDAPQGSFMLGVNNRKLIEAVLNLAGANKLDKDNKLSVVRTLDKWKKLKITDIQERLNEAGLDEKSFSILEAFMTSSNVETLSQKLSKLQKDEGLVEVMSALERLSDLGYGDWVQFDPAVIRGFDYYDGLVFEIYDQQEKNSRALFGGGRYNGLAEIFGENNFPAVGIAPGDETIRLFLEDWNLLEKIGEQKVEKYYLPLLDRDLIQETGHLAKELRSRGWNILVGLEEQKIGKALDAANKRNIDKVIILGKDELKKKMYKVKDMLSGEEIEFSY